MQPVERSFDVDERVGREHDVDLRSSGHQLGADDAAELRQEDAEPGVVVGHRLLAVDRVQQLVAADAAKAVEHEVGEEQLPLGPGQRVFDTPPIQPHHEPAAELDSRLARWRHLPEA